MTFRTITKAFLESKHSLRLRNRNKIMREIISTEESYVGSLAECLNLFYRPLKELITCENKSSMQIELTLDELDHMFINLEDIHRQHEGFLAQLHERIQLWPSVVLFG